MRYFFAPIDLFCRRKTLLWLDDRHDDPITGNLKIRCSIPGYKGCEKLEPCQDGQIHVNANNHGILLEDQVDLFLFTTREAIILFLNSEQQRKFIKYPRSLFRIVSNRRLFVGEKDGVLKEKGFCKWIEEDPLWKNVFPSIMVFHGDNKAGLQELNGRSNVTCTNKVDDCLSFVAFGAVISATFSGDSFAP
jgi:hypothetical protein